MNDDYNATRYRLFTSTHVCKLIISHIRKKYSIKEGLSSTEWLKRLHEERRDRLPKILLQGDRMTKENSFNMVWVFQDELTYDYIPEIEKLAEILKFDPKLLSMLILYNNVPNNINTYGKYYMADSFKPIEEKGVFIKVDHDTTLAEIKDRYKAAKLMALALSVVRRDKKNEKSHIPQKKRSPRSEERLKKKEWRRAVVIQVEKEIEILDSDSETKKEYGGVVMAAIERVSGNLVEDKGSDDEFAKEQQKFQRSIMTVYYSTLREYSLPPLKKFNSILGFIDS